MRSSFWKMLCMILCFMVLITGVVFSQTCNIDGFSTARTDGEWSFINGTEFTRLRGLVTSGAYFGTSGAVPITVNLMSGQFVVSSASLSGVNVFLTGYTLTSSYTSAERTALYNYVLNGGSLIIFADDQAHSIVSDYGVTDTPAGGSSSIKVVDKNNVLMDGPFGTVSKLAASGAFGLFSQVPGDALILASTLPGSPPISKSASSSISTLASNPGAAVVVIPEGVLGTNSGRVIILNDSDYSSAYGDAGNGPSGQPDNDIFMLNAFAYACGVVNSPGGNVYYFPQIALGAGYGYTAFISNSSSSSAASNILYDTFDENGVSTGTTPFDPLGAGGTGSMSLNGALTPPIAVGWARVRTASPIRIFPQLKIIQKDNSGTIYTAVGVPPSYPGTSFTLEGLINTQGSIGVAVVNIPTSTGPAHVVIKAFDYSGAQIGSTDTTTLAVGGHLSDFIENLVGLTRTSTNVLASITITSDQPVSVLGLLLDGGVLSGIPTFPGRQ